MRVLELQAYHEAAAARALPRSAPNTQPGTNGHGAAHDPGEEGGDAHEHDFHVCFIAERLGIGYAETRRCLDALAASRLIALSDGRWVATQVLAVDTRRNPEAGRALKAHWAAVGLERLPKLEPSGQDFFSYNLFTVSETDWERLRELHIAYYNELRRIVGASEPAERVALVNLQLMRLDEPLD